MKDILKLTPKEIDYSVVERMHEMSEKERKALIAKMSDAQLAKIMELTSPEARRKRMEQVVAAKLQLTAPSRRAAMVKKAREAGVPKAVISAAKKRVVKAKPKGRAK